MMLALDRKMNYVLDRMKDESLMLINLNEKFCKKIKNDINWFFFVLLTTDTLAVK